VAIGSLSIPANLKVQVFDERVDVDCGDARVSLFMKGD